MDVYEFDVVDGWLDLTKAPPTANIQQAILKCRAVINSHDSILCSISGGYDSDIMLDMIIRCGGKDKTTFVFYNTGLEYEATKRHIREIEQTYGINVEIVRPKKTIPTCVRDYGVPFMSKQISEKLYYLQNHNFQFEDEDIKTLMEKYPKNKAGIKWWCNDSQKKYSYFNINRTANLKEFIMENNPPMKISMMCCEKTKKEPAHKMENSGKYDLVCVGVRKYEGGIRSVQLKECFVSRQGKIDKFYPIFWLTDEDKEIYKNYFGIKLSDCYEIWGMKRTGCAGCPFNSKVDQEMELIKKYEPKLYNALKNIFGQSYEYRKQYKEYREAHKKKNM